MQIKEIEIDDRERYPTTLRLSNDTRENIESLKQHFGKARVTAWLRNLVESSVAKEVASIKNKE